MRADFITYNSPLDSFLSGPRVRMASVTDDQERRRRETLESFLIREGADPSRHTLVTYFLDADRVELNVIVPHAEAASILETGELSPQEARTRYPFVEII